MGGPPPCCPEQDCTKRLYKALTDNTKPQKDYTELQKHYTKPTTATIQRPKIFDQDKKVLDTDLNYLTKVATSINLT